mgnify:CR=1 FL=1
MTRRFDIATEGPAATIVLVASAVLFGLTPLFARALQAEGMSDAAIALSRYVFTALCLWPFLPRAREKRGEALLLFGAGLAMGAGWIGWLEAIRSAPVAAAGVVYMSYPLFTVLFAWLFAGMRPGRRAVAAAALVLAAAALLLRPGALAPGALEALLWSLPAPVTFGFIIVALTALTPRLRTFEKMACGLCGASLGLAPVAALGVDGALVPGSPEGWALLLALGVGTAFLPQLAYTLAAPRVGPARAAATGAVELPTMIAIGWLSFGEAVGLRELAAAALVIAAIFVAPALRADRTAPAASAA